MLDIEFIPPAHHSLDSYQFMQFFSEHFILLSDSVVNESSTQIATYNITTPEMNFYEQVIALKVNDTLNLETLIAKFKELKPLALIDDKIKFFYCVPMFIYLVHQIFEAEYKSLFKYKYESTIK